jgi:carbon starvation protein
VIILAVLALIVVRALAGSPWGLFTVAATIPLALLMGVYTRWIRPGRIGEVSLLGLVGLILAIIYGQNVAESATLAPCFTYTPVQLCWILIGYGAIAALLPVWLLLAPRDYLSTFLKIGAIAALAIGIVVVAPPLRMPALTQFIDGSGPVWSGSLFPFLFITIACGAVSGFHALIASGTTPKLIASEGDARFIGYGAMLMESFVAIMALVAASVIDPGVYFTMNSPAAVVGTDPASAAAAVTKMGFAVSADTIAATAKDVGETTIISRAGGAPTLAVGMAHIFSRLIGGREMMAFWYHFAILFEALFILTAVDAGTRGALHVAGSDRAGGAELPQCDLHRTGADRHRSVCRGLGVLPLPRRHRSVGRREYAVAVVRDFEPDARRGRADAGDGRAVPHEAAALRLGHDPAGELAGALHRYGKPDEVVRIRSARGPRCSGS